jgi:hypothetical protein
MPMETVPASGEDFRYALVSYDRDGAERPEGGALFSAEVADMLAGRPFSDVILVSHGWNGDLPAAREQYTRWFTTMLGRAADRSPDRAARWLPPAGRRAALRSPITSVRHDRRRDASRWRTPDTGCHDAVGPGWRKRGLHHIINPWL